MKRIYAPWREQYITTQDKTKSTTALSHDCIFCNQFDAHNDVENLILARFEHCAIVMNKFPYSSGHIMVLPLAHEGDLCKLSPDVHAEFFELVSASTAVLKQVINPAGFNVGLNLGKAAGAGIPTHLHAHIVPRWEGDTNFMPIIADTKPISFDMAKMYQTLKTAFEKIKLS